MSLKRKRTSHTTPPAFTYPTLPQEPYTTRMIRLLPHKDKSAPIQCELFNYDLSNTYAGAHLYQALSYVWGSEAKPESIILNGCTFDITANLHAALSHLRNGQFERILWVDAICINQDEEDQGYEKSKQIPLMRMIYAQAECVIVWLGDAAEEGDKALEEIRCRGEEQYTNSTLNTSENYDACLRLLQRDWFSRIWVLQEVGVARCVYVMCGFVSINGHVFCEGLSRLRLPSALLSAIGPVAHLIRGALYRPEYKLNSRGFISIGELIGMYHRHNAAKQHDKVYALLGLSADPIAAALEPNYSLPWKEVFKRTINYIFPECSVEAFIETETVLMRSEGWILGVINSVEENASRVGKQKIEVLFSYTALSLGYQYRWETSWESQASAALIQEGDIICLLKGASNPSIIRLCKDHFAVITPAVTPQQRQHKKSPTVRPEGMTSMRGLFDIPLIWKTPLAKTECKDEPEALVQLMDTPLVLQGEEQLEAEKRLKHIMLAVVDIALTVLNQEKFKTKMIEKILRQSGTKDSIAKELAEAPAAENRWWIRRWRDEDESPTETLSQIILQHQGNDLPISEETTIAATSGDISHSCIITELFLLYQRVSLPVSEKVVKEVAGSGRYGPEIMKILFRHRGNSLPVSEEVIKAAAGNRFYGPEILEILFQQDKNLPVTEEMVRAAAGNTGKYGPKILEILFQRDKNLPVTEEIVRAAAVNTGKYGPKILEILFQRDKNLPVTEEIVKAAAGDIGFYGPEILEVLFQQDKNLPVTEEIVKEAAGNGFYGHEILEVLFQHRGENLPVSEEVVRAAAGNNGLCGPRNLEVLFQHRGENLPVSEEVVRTAAGNNGLCGPEILEVLFQHRRENLPVSEEVVRAAAENNGKYGPEILKVLFQHRGENLPVSEEVVRAAAENNGKYGPEILKVLFQHRGNCLRETGLDLISLTRRER